MSTNTAPLFDMTKAVPVQQTAPPQPQQKPLFDMSKALPAGTSGPTGTAPQPSIMEQLTNNPDKEGLYRFIDTSTAPRDGDLAQWMKKAPVIYVPYSRALDMLGHPEHYRGFQFWTGEPANDWERLQQHVQTQVDMAMNPMQPNSAVGRQYVIHPDEVASLFHDYQHDPNRAAMRRGDFLSSLPPLQAAIGATREAARTATFGGKVGPEGAKQFAKAPQKNVFQKFGGGTEVMGEFMTGEELIGALSHTLGRTPSLVEAAKIEQEIQKGTPAGELFKQALTGGGIGGAQSYVKTGGDIGSAAQSALGMALPGIAGAGLAGTVEGVKAANAARIAEESRGALDAQTKFADDMEEFKWKQAKYDYDVKKQKWDEQVKAINDQHQKDVAAEQARHDQRVAEFPAQRETLRAAHNQNIADLEAQNRRNIQAEEAAHNARMAEWNRQNQEAITTARAQHEARETAKVAASQAARTTAQQDYETRVAEAKTRAQTAAEAERQRLTTEAEGVQQAETKATAQRYAETARASVEPHLRAVEEAGAARPVTMAQPGGAPGVVSGEIPAIVNFNTNEVLSQIGDYSGARTRLQGVLNQTNEALDASTNGRFTQLRNETSAAQTRVFNNESGENVAAYQAKLKEMDDLLGNSHIDPKIKDAVRQGWRQYYVLGDIGQGLDKSVMGVPGDSAISQIYRGTDGRKLTEELAKAVIKHGRPAVEAALGGADRLSTLEDIGRQTMTNAGRQKLNQAVVDVAKFMEPVEEPNLPPEYKKPPFVKPAPATPKPILVKPPEPEGMRAKFQAPEEPKFQKPAKPAYPTKPEPPAPRAPTPPREPTAPEDKGKLAAKWMVKKVVGAMAWGLGYSHGGHTGAYLAKSAAEAGMTTSSVAVQKVQSAMMSDPKIAKFLLYVARTGGIDPKTYGPAIATMIVNSQPEEEQTGQQ